MTTTNCFDLMGCPGSGLHKTLQDEPQTETFQLPDNHHNNSNHSKPDEKKEERTHSKSPNNNGQRIRTKQPAKTKPIPTHLPILIVPGFMSSGLEIKSSQSRPDWVGKRIWLNLSSLGLSALYFGSAQQKEDENEQQQKQHSYKSQWLEHMRLDSSSCRDPPGIQVRPIQGLEGVDYLTPGAFTNHVSYVFGPVITALQKAGYTRGVNLQAAPYDWRLPPSQLEQRDQYFTKCIQQVEELFHNNHGTPVVLLGHSLGTKTAHYFLNFALADKGQAWIDRYIHTYLPVGAPHLGAPKALRSVVAGDKMSLDAFLNDEEALVMGRSFGSGPWLFPRELPPGVPSSVYVLPHGVLEISFTAPVQTHDLVHRRTTMSKPNRYQVVVSYGANKTVHTPFTKTQHNNDQVSFTDKVSFATHPNVKEAVAYGRLRFFLQEPGIAAAKEDKPENSLCCCIWTPICCLLRWITCCCIIDYLYRLVRWILCGILVRGVALSADAITSGAGGGANLAFSTPMAIPSEVWSGKTVTRKVTLYHKDDYDVHERIACCYFRKDPRIATLQLQFRWIPYNQERSLPSVCSSVCEPDPKQHAGLTITRNNNKAKLYQGFAGHDILKREGLDGTLGLIHNVYDGDSIGPRTVDAPPVQRIHAIYGINVTTELAGVYKRKDRCLSENELKNLYKLDSKACLHASTKSSGYSIQNGVLYETKQTPQSVAAGRKVCGDGTVPFWSLQHCKTWTSAGKDVSVVELENAEHREILADARFHKALLDYCRIQKETV